MKDDIAADNSHLLRRGSAVPISSDNEISMEIDSGGSSFVKKSSESSANSDSYQEESQSIQTVDDYQEDSNAVPLSFVMKKSQQQGDKIINQFTLSDSSRSSSMPETVTADSKLQISDSSSPTYGFEQNPVCFGTITLDVRQNCNIDFQLTSSSLSSLSETINESQSQSLLDQQQNLINQEQQQLRLQSEQKSQSDSEQQQLTSQQLSLIKQIAQVKLLNQLDTQLEFSEQDLTDDELWQVLDMGTNGDDDDTAGELIVEAMVGSNSHKMDSNAVVNQDDNAKTISQRYKERNQNIKNIFDGLSKRGQNVHNINQNDNIYNIHKNVLGRFNKYPNQFLNVLQIIYHYFNSDRSVEIGPIDTWFDTEARKQYWRDNVQRIRPDGQAADSYDTYEYTNQVTKMYYNEMPYINIKVPQWAVDLNIPNYYGPGFFKKEVFDNVTNTTSTHTFIRVLKDDDKINLWMNLNDTMTKLILNSNTNSTNSSNSYDTNQTLSPLLTADPEIKLGTGPSSSSALTTNAALLTSWNTTGPSWEFDSASQTAVVGPCFGLLDELIVLTDIMHMEMRQNFENWEVEFMEHVYKTQYEGICDIPKVTREKCGSSSANRNGSPGQSNNILLPKQWDWNETKWNNSNWGPNAGAGSGNEYNQFMVYLKWSKQQNDQDTFDLIDESFYNLEEIKCNTLSSSSNPISQECRESLEHDWIQKKMHKPVDAPPGPQSGDILDMAPNIDCLQVLRKIADSNNTSNCSFSQVIYNPELIPTTQMFQFGRPNDSSITANETKQLVCDSESITPQCRKSIKQWIGTEIENQASSSEIGQKCQQWLNSTVIFGSHVNKSDQTNNYSLDSILIENSCRQTRSSTILHYDYMLDLEPWKPTTTTTTPRPLDRPYGWRTEGVELLQINQLGQVTVKTAESFGLWPDWDNDQPTEIDNQDLLSSNLQKQDSAAATVDVDISHCNGYYSLAPISLRSLDKLEAIHGKFGADKKYISQQYSKNDYHGIGQAYPTLDNQKDEEFYEGAVFFGQTHKYAADFTSVIKIDVLDEQESIMRGRIMLLEGQKFGGRGEPVCIWTLVCPRKDSLNRTYMNSNDKTTFWQYYDTRYNNDIASIASFQQDSFEKNRLFEKNVVLQTVNDKIGRWDWSKMDFASLTESAIVEDQARTGSEGGPVLEFEKYAILDAIQGIVDWESNVDKIQQFSVSTNAQQQADIVKNCRYRSSNDINTIVSQLYNSDTSYFNNLAILDANVGATSDQAQRLTQLNTLMDQKHLINPTPETGSSVGDKRIYMHDFLEEMSLEGQISQAKLEQMQGTIKQMLWIYGSLPTQLVESKMKLMKIANRE